MALKKVRAFQYRPSRPRQEQLAAGQRHGRIELPRAGEANRPGSLKLLILLVGILALAFVIRALH